MFTVPTNPLSPESLGPVVEECIADSRKRFEANLRSALGMMQYGVDVAAYVKSYDLELRRCLVELRGKGAQLP